MGPFKVIGRSVFKALKYTGITVGTAAATAAGVTMQNPEIMTPIWAATGPIAPIALIGLSILGQTVVDAVKHRDKM